MENVPMSNLQIVINKMQVSIRELSASNVNPDGMLYRAEPRHFHEVLYSKFNEPLTFTSNILMNNINWQEYSPPAEILSGIEGFNGSKWGIPQLSTIITRSIGEAASRKKLGFLEAASQSNKTTSILTISKKSQASSSSSVTVAGPSRSKLETIARDKDTSIIEENQPSRVNSQLLKETSTTSDSGYISAAEKYHSGSSSRLPRQGCSKLTPLARFIKMLKKRQHKGKSVVAEPLRECVSCLDDFPVSDMVHVQCHDYCKDCFERLVITAMETESMWPVKCCLNDISHKAIVKNVNPNLAKEFQLKVCERKIASGDRIYCIKPRCESWIPNSCIDKGRKCASCPSCKGKVCVTCRGSWHANMECPQDKDIQATASLADERGWKQCYNCRIFIELNKGCRHMKCRCKAEWCYVCSAKWKTCGCTEFDLDKLVLNLQLRQEAAARETQLQETKTRQEEEQIRREAVRIRKAAEEERIAIQMVEDFERREADGLGREAESVFQFEEAVRGRREDMASKFIEIREELNALHHSQKSRLATRSQEEFRMLQERGNGFYKLLKCHVSQCDQLKKEYKTEYSNQELRFQNEYDQRREEEIRAEKENTEKLETFWKDKPDAAYIIRAAKDSHQEGYIVAFRNWDFNRKIALQECTKNFELKNSSLIRSQILDDANFRLKMRDEWREWARNKVAEVRWFDAVIAEREHMLQTLENEQYTMATAESERGRSLIPAQLLNRDDPSPVIAPVPSIPSCAIPCIASAVSAETSCGATDLACQCNPDNANLIQGVATSCVLQACGIQEALQVLDDATAECSSVIAAGNANAAPSSAAPSVIASAVPTSVPVSISAVPSSVPTTTPIDSSPPSAVPSSVAGSVSSAVPSSVPNASPNATFVIPACADSCIQNAIGSTSCGLTNFTCQCEKSNAEIIQAATVYCIAADCGENGVSVAIEINRSQVDNCTALSTLYNSSSSITGSVTANGPTQISLTGNPSGISTALPPCGPPIPASSAAPTDPGSVGSGPSYYGYPTPSNPIVPPGSPTSGAGDPSETVSSTPTDPGSASSTNISVDPSDSSGSVPTDPSSPISSGSFPSGAGSSTPTDPGSAPSTSISADPSGIASSTPTDPGSASSTSLSADPPGGSGSSPTDPSSPISGGSFPSGGSTPVDPGSASSTNTSVDPSGTSGSSSTIPGSFPSSSSPVPTDPAGGVDPTGAASSTYSSDPSGASSTPPGGNDNGPSYGYGHGYGTYYPSSTPTPTGNGGDPSDPSGSGGVSVSSSATGAVSSSSQSIGAPSTSGGDPPNPSTSGGDLSSPSTTGGDSSSPTTSNGDPSSPSTTNSDPSPPTISSGLNNPSSFPSGTNPSSSSPFNSNNPPPTPPASGGYYGYNPGSAPSSPTFTSPSTPAIPTSPTDPNPPSFRLSLLPSRYSLLTYIMRVYFNLSPPSPFISSRGLTTNSRTSACLFSISSSGLLSCSGSSSSNSHSRTGNADNNTEDAKTRYFGDEFARAWDSGYTVLQTRNRLRDMQGKDLNGTLVVDSTSEYPYGSLLKLRNGEFIGNDNQARFCAQTSSSIPSTYGSANPDATQSQPDAFLEGSPVRAYINGTQGLPANCQEVKLVIEWVDGGA
ncbi:putative ibr domain-containing protein [Botrytis fragariae]|uniref:RBR-type E3 ubiquitin transferase n=1 Tax=Botrytis fragariae TaxID=1964551 RepID=A0A8H6EDX4_9HELO|nr:putative ibr domain-containing protein [Botrytis fragariae]KAF5868727.1 putative ibr domain-containing protein [Botrytis fragariae]